MLRLIIDTALGYMGIGLARDGDLLVSVLIDHPQTITTTSVGAIDFVLTSVHEDKKKIEEIVVSGGPGTFTSLRTGISLAKGVGMALNVPLVPVSTLDAMAHTAGWYGDTIVTAVDGKNNNIYLAEYIRKGDTLDKVMPDTLIKADKEPLQKKQYSVQVIGFDVERYKNVLADGYREIVLWEKLDVRRMAGALLSIAAKRLYGMKQVNAAEYIPVYLRQPDINKKINPGPVPRMGAPTPFEKGGKKGI